MKLGFACKWIDTIDQCNGIKSTDAAKIYNMSTTTLAWLGRQHPDTARNKLWDLTRSNVAAIKALIERVATLPDHLRMVRIGSDVLPMYSGTVWSNFYKDSTVQQFLDKNLAAIGQHARDNNVRLSFHPGQFCVLASENPNIVTNSIAEFEYHADLARWMGYGQKFQDFKINIHVSGKAGIAGMRAAWSRLSTEARNCITIENEEITWGLDHCLELTDLFPVVLDVHHHWVMTGEYIRVNDPRIARIIDSWRGVRPVIHYSQTRETELPDHAVDIAPDRDALFKSGLKKSHLRAHSNLYWNAAVNSMMFEHLDWADMMCEAKAKNLASFALAQSFFN